MRRFLSLLIDCTLVFLSTALALWLRDNFEVNSQHLSDFLPYLAVSTVIAVPVLIGFGMDRSIWRFSAMSDYLRVLVASLVIAGGALGVGFVINRLDGVARSLPVMQVLLMSFTLVGIRILARLIYTLRQARAA